MRPDSDRDVISIPYNKGALLVVVVGAGLFVATAPFIIHAGIQDGGVSIPLCFGFAVVDVLFFGGGLMWAIRALRSGLPALEIDDEGLVDRSSAVSAGRLEWDEIDSINIPWATGSMICIVLKDRKSFLGRQPVWKRLWMIATGFMIGTPALISGFSVSWPLAVVAERIEAKLTAYRLRPFGT